MNLPRGWKLREWRDRQRRTEWVRARARERELDASRTWKLFVHTETRNFSSFAFLASFELLSCVYSVTVEFFLYLFSQSKVFAFLFQLSRPSAKQRSHIDNGEHKFDAFNALEAVEKANFQCWKIYIIFFFQKRKIRKKFPNFFLSLSAERVWEWKFSRVRENPREENSFFSFRHFFLFWIFFVIGRSSKRDEIWLQFEWKVLEISCDGQSVVWPTNIEGKLN